MNNIVEQPEHVADVRKQVESLLEIATLSLASELARSGKYTEAEDILLPIIESARHKGTAVDLLAKINAQQGYYNKAIILWERALNGDPDNNNFQQALKDCRQLQGGNHSRHKWNLTANIIIGINVVIVIGILLVITIVLNAQ